ncbi:unnamed protein product, partial [Prorocentrum cordatum]
MATALHMCSILTATVFWDSEEEEFMTTATGLLDEELQAHASELWQTASAEADSIAVANVSYRDASAARLQATPCTYQAVVGLLALLSAREDDQGATAYAILFLLWLAFACLRFSDLGRGAGVSLGRDALRAVCWRSKGKPAPVPWAALRVTWTGVDSGKVFFSHANGVLPQSADSARGWIWPSMALANGALEFVTPVRHGSYANCLMAMAAVRRLAGHTAHYALHSPRFSICGMAGQAGFALEERRGMGRWGPASGMPIRYDQSRCCAELAAKERERQKLRPCGDYELPMVDEVATELRARAHAAKQRAAAHAPGALAPQPPEQPPVRVLINHKTGMLHKDPPCKQVRDPTLPRYEQAAEDQSNLHLYPRCDRCFRTSGRAAVLIQQRQLFQELVRVERDSAAGPMISRSQDPARPRGDDQVAKALSAELRDVLAGSDAPENVAKFLVDKNIVKLGAFAAEAEAQAKLEAAATGDSAEKDISLDTEQRERLDAQVKEYDHFVWPAQWLPANGLMGKLKRMYEERADFLPRLEVGVKSILEKEVDPLFKMFFSKQGGVQAQAESACAPVQGLTKFRGRHFQLMIAYNQAAAPEFENASLTVLLEYHQWLMEKIMDVKWSPEIVRDFLEADFRMHTEWMLSWQRREFTTFKGVIAHHRGQSAYLFSDAGDRGRPRGESQPRGRARGRGQGAQTPRDEQPLKASKPGGAAGASQPPAFTKENWPGLERTNKKTGQPRRPFYNVATGCRKGAACPDSHECDYPGCGAKRCRAKNRCAGPQRTAEPGPRRCNGAAAGGPDLPSPCVESNDSLGDHPGRNHSAQGAGARLQRTVSDSPQAGVIEQPSRRRLRAQIGRALALGEQPRGRCLEPLIQQGCGPEAFLEQLPRLQHPAVAPPPMPAAWMQASESSMQKKIHPDVHKVIGHLHLPLLEWMVEHAKYSGADYVARLMRGKPCLGEIPPSGVFSEDHNRGAIAIEDWIACPRERNERMIRVWLCEAKIDKLLSQIRARRATGGVTAADASTLHGSFNWVRSSLWGRCGAAVLAPLRAVRGLGHRLWIHFIDNTDAMHAPIKGNSVDADLNNAMHATWKIVHRRRLHLWVEYVNTHDNPVDKASRGCTDDLYDQVPYFLCVPNAKGHRCICCFFGFKSTILASASACVADPWTAAGAAAAGSWLAGLARPCHCRWSRADSPGALELLEKQLDRCGPENLQRPCPPPPVPEPCPPCSPASPALWGFLAGGLLTGLAACGLAARQARSPARVALARAPSGLPLAAPPPLPAPVAAAEAPGAEQLGIASADLSGLRFGPSGGGLPVGLTGGQVHRFAVAPALAELAALLAEGASAVIVERQARGLAQPAGAAAAGGVGGIAHTAVPLPLPAPPAPAAPGAAAPPPPPPRRAGAGGTWVLDVPGKSRVVGQEVALSPAALDFGGRSVVAVAGEFSTVTRLEAAPFLADASLLVRDPSVPIRLRGPPTMGDAVTGLQSRAPGGSLASHERWLVESRVGAGSRSAHDHRVISKALELAVSTDGFNLANLTSMEYLNRRRQLLEEAHAKDPEKADFEGARHFIGEDEVSPGALAAPSPRAHVVAELSREAAIDDERRKAKEAKKPGPNGTKEKDCAAPQMPPPGCRGRMQRSGESFVRSGRLGMSLLIGSLSRPVKPLVGFWARPPTTLVRTLLFDLTGLIYFLSGRSSVPMATVLDNDAARLLVDYETALTADDDVFLQRREGGPGRPYFDSVLCSDRVVYVDFLMRLADVNILAPLPSVADTIAPFFVGEKDGPDSFTGDIYPDGLVFEAEYPSLASAGWGCVALHPDCLQVVSFCSCPVLDPLQCISAAELIAVIHVLRFAVPPVRMFSDSAFVVDGFHERGRVATTACVAAHVHLWREFWRSVDDWGGGFELSKVKGHAAVGDIQHGRATARHRLGNLMADRAAKSAAAFARVPRQSRAQLQARSKVVKTWGDWIGRLSDGLEDCGHPKRHNRGKPRLPRLFVVRNPVPSDIASRVLAAQRQLGDGARKHDLVRIALCEGPTVVGCARCGSCAVSRVAALSQPCPPVATDHALQVLKRLCKGEFRLSAKVFRVAAQAPLAEAAAAVSLHAAQLEAGVATSEAPQRSAGSAVALAEEGVVSDTAVPVRKQRTQRTEAERAAIVQRLLAAASGVASRQELGPCGPCPKRVAEGGCKDFSRPEPRQQLESPPRWSPSGSSSSSEAPSENHRRRRPSSGQRSENSGTPGSPNGGRAADDAGAEEIGGRGRSSERSRSIARDPLAKRLKLDRPAPRGRDAGGQQ